MNHRLTTVLFALACFLFLAQVPPLPPRNVPVKPPRLRVITISQIMEQPGCRNFVHNSSPSSPGLGNPDQGKSCWELLGAHVHAVSQCCGWLSDVCKVR